MKGNGREDDNDEGVDENEEVEGEDSQSEGNTKTEKD